MNKFALYRFTAPFRSRTQGRLREMRLNVSASTFAQALDVGDRSIEIASLLWDILREQAFVPDFRPMPDDSLSAIYAMGPEEVRDDVIGPLLTKLGLSVDGFDFAGFNFSSIATPRDVGRFVMKVADAEGEGKRRLLT